MEIFSTKKLIKNAFRAIIKPHKVFKEIPENQRINYKKAIPLLLFGGLIFAILHFQIAQGKFILDYPLTGIIHLIILPFFSLGIWLFGSICFYQIAKFFKKKVSIEKIEIGVFYLWLVWFLMPLFDVPHLFGFQYWDILGIGAHFSWFFAFAFIPLLSFFLLKDLLRFSKKDLGFAVLISLSIPFLGRFFIEELPTFLNNFLRIFNKPIGYHLSAILIAPFLFIFIFSFWLSLKRNHPFRRYLLPSGLSSLSICIVLICLIFFTPLLNLIPSGPTLTFYQTFTGDFSQGKSYRTHSYTWVSSDYETGTIRHPPIGSGNDNNDSYWNDEYLDVVDLDFDPTKTTVTEIRVKVHFTANTVNNQGGAGPRAQACFAGDVSGAGTYYCSAWVENLNGASDQTFIINESNIRTYDPDGLGAAGGSTEWNNLVSAMTQNDNDVLVHSWTQGDGNGNQTNGDVIGFDSVVVEIDYKSDLTQTTYRWYNNADSVQPGTAKAAENTAITGVADGDILRARISVQIQTGTMGINTEAFKLQYGQGSDCSAISTWTDVDVIGGTGIWRGYNNTTPADGAQITSSLLDSQTNALESYEEQNPSVNNPAAITDKGEWDWVVQNNNAPANTTYCFRMVEDDGTVFDTYTNYPKLTTAAANQPPTVDSVNISPSPINLNAGSTKTVTITATISDPDGCEDVFTNGSISGVFYDAAVESDSCTADDNDCYPNLTFTEVDDTCSGAGDTTAEAQAIVDVWFIANASNQWTAKVIATDSQSQSATNTQTVTINELAAFKLDVSSIDYGTVNPNEVSAEKAVKITTIGNIAVDVKLSGEDLTWSSYTIPVSQQKYSSTSGFDWETEGTALTGTSTCYELSTGKPTTHPSNQSEYIYWKLKVPLDKPAETYSGTINFDVVPDSTCP